MKRFLFILIMFFSLKAFAQTNYYFAASGSDAGAGTQASPYQTITKLNSLNLVAGDHVYFNKSDTFYGTISINSSGTSSNNIVFSSYGTGANPVISGFTTISSWTSIGNGVYQNTCSSCSFNLNVLTFQDTLQPMGRFPKITAANGGYLKIDSHSGMTSLTSTGLSGAANFVGGQVVTRKLQFIIERESITAQSGTTLTTNPTSLNAYDYNDGYGFFIQNNINCLTQLGDWAYDSTHKYIQMYFGANTPSNYTVKATSLEYNISCGSRSYITFDGLTFEGSNTAAIYFTNTASFITFQNCSIQKGMDGIYISNSSLNHITLDNCTVQNLQNNGITGQDSQYWTITNNTFNNIGIIRGGGFDGEGTNGLGQFEGMAYIGGNSLVQYNTVKNIGYIGIEFRGDNTQILNNLVDTFDLIMEDGGAIYTYNETTATGRKVIGNIVINGIGDRNLCGEDLTNPYDENVQGIYMDDHTNGVDMENNTVAFINGGAWELHSPTNVTMYNNTSFKASVGHLFIYDDGSGFSGLSVKNNIFFGKQGDELLLHVDENNDNISTWGTIDSNYYCRPIYEPQGINTTGYSHGINDPSNPYNDGGIVEDHLIGTGDTYKSLDVWQTYSNVDTHSKKTPMSITDTSQLKFVYNASKNPVTQSLQPYKYMDARGNVYDGTITLQPYTSAVLIQDGNATQAGSQSWPHPLSKTFINQ